MTSIETASSSLRAYLADELRANRKEIVARWLERISARVALDDNKVFPTEELLNHVPILIDGIAGLVMAYVCYRICFPRHADDRGADDAGGRAREANG